jgi:hypothetical protein
MKNRICAAIAVAIVAGAPLLSAFAAEGPRPSSYNNWPGMMDNAAPAIEPAASPFDGPRPSSLDNWPGMMSTAVPATVPSASPFDGPRPSSAH